MTLSIVLCSVFSFLSYTECYIFIVVLSVVMLNAVMLSVVMLNAVMLSVMALQKLSITTLSICSTEDNLCPVYIFYGYAESHHPECHYAD